MVLQGNELKNGDPVSVMTQTEYRPMHNFWRGHSKELVLIVTEALQLARDDQVLVEQCVDMLLQYDGPLIFAKEADGSKLVIVRHNS